MVDRMGRDRCAELLRHFAAGVITNDEYEDRWEAITDSVTGRDQSLDEVWFNVWGYYSDLSTHTSRGRHHLSRTERREFARWMLFLYSESEYEWPEKWGSFPGCSGCLLELFLELFTLGLWGHVQEWKQNERERLSPETYGDRSVWPFFRREDDEVALSRPRLLKGLA